ncbi:MAG: hypothetical protein ACPL09_06715 [Candidatus Methanodesulfokora sp.]
METEPLELIIVIVMISIALFSIYSYSRTTTTASQSFENRRLLARNIASMIADMWKFQFVNGSLNFNEFNQSVKEFLQYVEGKNGVHLFVNISFVYWNGTEANFTLYRSSGAGRENATAFAPAVVSWNISDAPLKVREYVVQWADFAYYRKGNTITIYTPFFFITQYSDGIPITSKNRIIKLRYTVEYVCSLPLIGEETRQTTVDPADAKPIVNGGAIVNSTSVSLNCPFPYQFSRINKLTDIMIYNCSSDLADCLLIYTKTQLPATEGNPPQFLINNRTESGKVVYLYLLGQRISVSASSWTITNRKGESLSGSGNIIPIDPHYSYAVGGNAGFFLQGAFNLTGGGQRVPFYVLPYMVIFKVKVNW